MGQKSQGHGRGGDDVTGTPDERRVAFSAADGLWLRNLETGEQRHLLRFEQAGGETRWSNPVAGQGHPSGGVTGVYGLRQLVWSPDGVRLAFTTMAHEAWATAVMEVDSGRYERAGGLSGELAWAPDSGRLAIAAYGDEDVRFALSKPATSSSLEDIGPKLGPADRVYRAGRFSSTGAQLAAIFRTAADDSYSHLLVFNVDGSNPRILDDAGRKQEAIFSGNDGSLFYIEREGGQSLLKTIDLQGGSRRLVVELPAQYDTWDGLAWTDDRRLVAVGRTAYHHPDGSRCPECPDKKQLLMVDPGNGTITYRSPVLSRATRFLGLVRTG